MDGGLDLAAIGGVAAAGGGVVGAVDFDDFTGFVFDDGLAGDEVGVAEADFGAGGETIVLLGRDFAEIVVVDVDDL